MDGGPKSLATGRRSRGRIALALFVVVTTTIALDLLWIGILASRAYDMLGSLRRAPVYLPATVLFYAFYGVVTYVHAVEPAATVRSALGRGARLGLVAYGTYELTNWAVLNGWPALLVPLDMGWGVVLTMLAAGAGRWSLGGAAADARRAATSST